MMQIDGKTYYQISDAEQEFGYTKGTLVNYISSGVIDADKMEDGEWFISETGWVQLRRRKNSVQHKQSPASVQPIPEVKTPVPVVDATKKVKPDPKSHKPDGFSEGALYIRSEEERQVYESLKQAGVKIGKTAGDMAMIAVRYYVRNILIPNMKKIEELEHQKENLLSGMV